MLLHLPSRVNHCLYIRQVLLRNGFFLELLYITVVAGLIQNGRNTGVDEHPALLDDVS